MPTESREDQASRMTADEVIGWLRDYAETRIQSRLIDERRAMPAHVVLDFGNRGLLGLRVPRRYGGLELTQSDTVRVYEQLGAIDLTLATFVSSHSIGLSVIQKHGSASLREALLPRLAAGREISAFGLTERAAGSNPRAIQTRADPDGAGGWILNGEKYLIDSGSWASVVVVFARTADPLTGAPAVSVFAVRQGTPGLVIGGESMTMGMRGMVKNSLRLENVRVGPDELLGHFGSGIAISQETLSIARLNLAAKAVGGIKRCLQLMRRYASRRRVATGPLWDNPVTQSRVGELMSGVFAIEALVRRVSRNVDAGENVPPEAFLACKLAASEDLWRAADALLQVMGGRGYEEPNFAPQILRDARSFPLNEGPTETLRMYLGSRVLHAGSDVARYITETLGSPAAADRLREAAESVRRRHAGGELAERIGESNQSYWASSQMGEVAVRAMLFAAAERDDRPGRDLAAEWASARLTETIRGALEAGSAEIPLGHDEQAADRIAGYAETIGDVEQGYAGADTHPDPLVTRSGGDAPAAEASSELEAQWPADLAQRVGAFASLHGATLESALVAALAALVYRHTLHDRVIVRFEDEQGREKDLTLPVSGSDTFEESVTRARLALAGSGDAPSSDVRRDAPPDVVLSKSTRPRPRRGPARGLAVRMLGGDGRATTWNYDGHSIAPVSSPDLAARLEQLLWAWTASPEEPLARLSILPPEERERVLHAWNETFMEYPRNASIPDLFALQVARVPERVALVCDGDSLTYRELGARAEGLARALADAGVRRGDPVGVCVDRSPDLLVSLLGILQAGGAYVPLDVAQPRRRLAHVLDDTRIRVIVAQVEPAAMLPEHRARIVAPDVWRQSGPARAAAGGPAGVPADLEHRPSGDDIAYVLYTSGSTGTPKGVEVFHRSVVNFLLSMRKRPGFSEDDTAVAVTTISFDMAGLELFLPLVTGGRVVLANARTAQDGVALARLIEESGATVLQGTPATWQMLLASGWRGRSGLKALSGGETLPRDLARGIRARTGSLWNLYGPTETTIWSCVEEVADSGPVSIGRPIDNTRVYLLDEGQQPVPTGVPAEIVIGGDGVARGYWRRDELTRERFLPDPFAEGGRMYRTGDLGRFLPDGRIEHLGRLDHQVKIRGYRIELGEIETALTSHPAVREAVVEPRVYTPEDTRLIAWVIPRGAAPAGLEADLREHVRDRVPAYMVPSAFMAVDAFPLTPNGKVDRLALRTRDAAEERGAEPAGGSETSLEAGITAIWSSLLRVSKFTPDADFFELGGHSLLATQAISRMRDAFGVEISIERFFERPTVSALAEAVRAALGVRSDPASLEAVPHDGDLEPSTTQQRLWFLEAFEPGATYNVPVAIRFRGNLDVEALRRAFRRLVERHEPLRTRFDARGGRLIQRIQPAGSVELDVADLEALSPEARAEAATRIVREQAEKPFDFSSGPPVRATLLRSAHDDHTLALTMHHIVTDGWSIEILLRDLGALYAAPAEGASPLAPLRIQFADYAAWQNRWFQGSAFKDQLAYWTGELHGLPSLDLPSDRPRPSSRSHRGSTVIAPLSPELTRDLHALSRKQGATIFMILMAAWQALLSRYSGQEDFGVGFPIANRHLVDVENLVGCFLNTLVLRADIHGDPTYAELVRRVRERSLKAYGNQAVPFDRLVQELGVRRDRSRNPLFQTMLDLQTLPVVRGLFTGLDATPVPVTTHTAKFDLTLYVREEEGRLVGVWEFSEDLFDGATIERMAGHFQTLLESVVADPEQRVADLPLLTPAEQSELLSL